MMTLERKAIRACRTEASRARMGDAFCDLGNARLARNAYKGVRRAHRRAVTLLAEYLGVGERVPTVYAHQEFEEAFRLMWEAPFRRVMSEDRCMP